MDENDGAAPNNPQNPQDSGINQTQINFSQSKPPRSHSRLTIALIVIAAVIIVLFLLYMEGILPSISALSNIFNSSPPSAFSAVNSPQNLSTAMYSVFNSSSAFNISYAGSYANSVTYSILGSNIQKTYFNTSIAKYGDHFRAFFNETPLGSGTLVVYNGTHYTYCSYLVGTCLAHNANSGAVQYLNAYFDSFLQGMPSNEPSASPPFTNLSSTGFGNVSYSSLTLKYTGQGTYDGEKCSNIELGYDFLSVPFNATGNMSSRLCYSNTIGLPLGGYVNLSILMGGAVESYDIVLTSHINKAPTGPADIITLPNFSMVGNQLTNYSTVNNNPTEISTNGTSCGNFTLSNENYPSGINGTCFWNGGNLNATYAGGDSGYAAISLIGQDGKTYLSNSTTLWGACDLGAATNPVYLPAQNYTLTLHSGSGGGICGNAFVTLN